MSEPTCVACPLHTRALTVCVKARGAEQARILIVGQNPGREEDFEGRAFVGKSGQLLDQMLADAGFAASDVRLTNAVRCVTPQNRAPFPVEIAACSSHLLEEIQRVRPSVIIALGEIAVKALLGNRKMSDVRGKANPLHEKFSYSCDVWATFHPAYVLRNPNARSVVVTDLRRVRDRHLEQTPIEWEYWSSHQSFHKAGWDYTTTVAYDIETFDERGEITENMTQAAVSDGVHTFVAVGGTAQVMLQHLAARVGTVVSHNGWAFDDLKTGVRSDYDTMSLAYLDDETQPLGLEALCVKYLGVRGWKEERDAPLGSKELAVYNARDALYTARLFTHLRDKLGSRIKIIDHIIRPGRLALDAIQERGVWIDGEEVERQRVTTQALLDDRRERVLALVRESGFADDAFDVQLKTKVRRVSFNPNSNAHVARVFEWLGFTLPLTASGEPSVDKEALFYIDHPLARAVEEYREVQKRMSTYIAPFAEIAATGDGRARTKYGVLRTLTGRTNSSGRNLQNLDRGMKKIKSAPPGKVLASWDYSAVEFRMGAFTADERTIIENYQRNSSWDPHTWFAARLYDCTEDDVREDTEAAKRENRGDSKRQIAKSANFSQLFLGDGHTIQSYAAREMGLALSYDLCERTHKAWHAAFPGWAPWYMRIKQDLIERGYTESPTGRRRNYGDFSLLAYDQRLSALREMCNAMVQGFCADIALIALGACHRAGLPLVDFVHDEFSFEFDSMEQAQQAEPLIRRCLIDEPLRVLREEFGVVPTVPLEIEGTYRLHERPVLVV